MKLKKTCLIFTICLFFGVNGVTPDNDTGYNNSPIINAAVLNNRDVIEELVKMKDVDINAKDEYGETALFKVVANNNRDIADLLLAHGAQVNTVNNRYYSPLYLAALNGSNEMINLLLNNGANIDYQTEDTGATPLQIAIERYRPDTVALLLERKANPRVRNTVENIDALGVAKKYERDDIITLVNQYY